MSACQPALLIRASACVAAFLAVFNAQAQSSSRQNIFDDSALKERLKSTPEFLTALRSDKPRAGNELMAAAGLNKASDAIDNERELNKLFARLCGAISPAPLEKYQIRRTNIHSMRKEARAKDLENVTKRLQEEIEFTKLSTIEDTGRKGEVIRRSPPAISILDPVRGDKRTETEKVLTRYFELKSEVDNDPSASKAEKAQIAAFENLPRDEKLRLLAQFDAKRANSGTRSMGGSYRDRVDRTLKAHRPEIEARFKSIEETALKAAGAADIGCVAPVKANEGLSPAVQPVRQ